MHSVAQLITIVMKNSKKLYLAITRQKTDCRRNHFKQLG